jgi:uncharacterized protein (DUF58 family)
MDILNRLQTWLLKRTSLEDNATLTPRRIYILPTREGVIYALLVLVMLASAINFNNSLVFFFTFLMAGIGIISMHKTQQNLLGLEFSFAHIQPVFCQQQLSLPLIIQHCSNIKLLKSKQNYSIELEFRTDNKLIEKSAKKSFADVHFHEKTQVELGFRALKRGYLKLPPITVSSRYPLGLFRAWANIELNNDAIIYPKPSEAMNLTQKVGSESEGQGESGRGFDDFTGFKTYQSGESLKHIHWKAYAREQGLLSKTFSGCNNREYWLDYNTLTGDTEHRLSQLCRLIIDAEAHSDRYGLRLPGLSIAINNGYAHRHDCLKALAMFQMVS